MCWGVVVAVAVAVNFRRFQITKKDSKALLCSLAPEEPVEENIVTV